MENESLDPVDLSAEAALELEELKQGSRREAPALHKLITFLRTPAPAYHGESVSMLEDVRSYALFRDAMNTPQRGGLPEFRAHLAKYLSDLDAGVTKRHAKKIEEAKQFCLRFSENLLNRQMADIYGRRESADSK